jgi:signal recognition particle receptor subunit beta
MVFFNYALRKLNAKIVYYGPGLCGKTTNLQWIHDHFEGGQKGKMISLATEGDRTIFFDLLPLEIGTIRGMEVTLQLYTVPGQVHYNSTRQLVLRGADGVVFVADSQRTMQQSNIDSLKNLQENLMLQGISLEKFPHAIQFNKRDLRDLLSPDEMNQQVNPFGMPWFEAVATEGAGVQETLEGIVKLVMRSLKDRYETMGSQGPQPVVGPSAPAPAGAQAGPWPVPPKGPSPAGPRGSSPVAPQGAPARPQASAPPPQQSPVPPPPRPASPEDEPTKVYGDRSVEPSPPAAASVTRTPPEQAPNQPQARSRPEQPPVTPPASRPTAPPAPERAAPTASDSMSRAETPAPEPDVDPHAVTATGSLFGEASPPPSDDSGFPPFDDQPPPPPAFEAPAPPDPEPPEPEGFATPPDEEPPPRHEDPLPSWQDEPATPEFDPSPPAQAPAAAESLDHREPVPAEQPVNPPPAARDDRISAPGPFAPAPGGARRGDVDDLVASVLNRATTAAIEAGAAQPSPGPPGSGREAVVVGDQEPFAEPVRTRATDLSPSAEAVMPSRAGDEADAGSADDANSLAVRLTGRGAIVERGQVSNLDIEVPVPGTLVGNKRVTLQLRLTLTPVEEDADGGAS